MINDEVRRELIDLLRGRTFTASSFNLSVAPAVSTTISKELISSNSVILTQAFSALALQGDITSISRPRDHSPYFIPRRPMRAHTGMSCSLGSHRSLDCRQDCPTRYSSNDLSLTTRRARPH
jgi:hypothetical protein